ncbi:MAG: AAA family ATPase, partial [Methylobacteriaceae bacterium]|nr:AAA family ATPase [Methylobacteriaceae bacterium]
MKLNEVHIKGFKSFDNEAGVSVPLGPVTVLLGANGSGKSNLVSFFKLLNALGKGKLQSYLGYRGVNRVLYYGQKTTSAVSFRLGFSSDADDTGLFYAATLSRARENRLQVSTEDVSLRRGGERLLSAGLARDADESGLQEGVREHPELAELAGYLKGVHVYQFHDTSDTARI